MAIARSTPAQKPRGFASRMSIVSGAGPARATDCAPLEAASGTNLGGGASSVPRKRRITPAARVKDQEVDDVAERQAIVQVAKRAADDERKAYAVKLAAAALQ